MKVISDISLENASSFNEADVRYHFVNKVVEHLGYDGTNGTYLKLEEKLEYPYYYIGHKSKKKDLPLGYPDYRAGLKGRRGSFIIEAKSPSKPISDNVVGQAHSYATHAEVGANYFVLCDGLRFQIYESLSGPSPDPIVDLKVSEIDEYFYEIENILSPLNLQKNCNKTHDTGLRLSDGLGSSIGVLVGSYDLQWAEYRFDVGGVDQTETFRRLLPQLAELDNQIAMMRECKLVVEDGTASRNEHGRIVADVKFSGITKSNQQAMQLMGLDKISFETEEKFISTDSSQPTAFEAVTGFEVHKGVALPTSLFGGQVRSIDVGVNGDLFISASMVFSENAISGSYGGSANYYLQIPGIGKTVMEFDFSGEFNLRPLGKV